MKVSPATPEWNHVRFRIQLTLADPSVQIVQIIKYSNQFDPKYMGYMKIDCGINATNLQQNSLQAIKQGKPSRFIFEAGHMNIKTQPNATNKFLLCKLAISQAMPIHKSGATQLSHITQFPNGIDTIYVSENKEQLNIYPHKYRVKDNSQICLQYEVDFIRKGINKIEKWNSNQIICENCQVAKAVYYCPQDREVYCGKCYEQLHRSTKKKTHDQKKLSPFNCAPFCPFHAHQRQLYYCLDCMQLKCQDCIQNQTHKNVKKHTEIMLLENLQSTLKLKQVSFLKESKQKTKSLILEAQEALKKLQNMYDSQKRDMTQKFTARLSKIREDSNRNIMKVVSIHTELKRKLDEFLWVENYIEYCEEFLLVQDNIQTKDSFFVYLERITSKQYFVQAQKHLEQALATQSNY